jgi:hypothetical protein
MEGRAVLQYDLSGNSGWAVYSPELDEPVFGVLRLPPTSETGSVGPAYRLLCEHIEWANQRWPLRAIGYEDFLVPTGGKKDAETPFVTSPKTIKKLLGLIAIVELCAAQLEIPVHPLHNASWRKYWLGSQKRGTKREDWKELSVGKARGLGWPVKGDDDADALGQLHFLLAKLEIRPRYGRNPSRELAMLGVMRGVPVGV